MTGAAAAVSLLLIVASLYLVSRSGELRGLPLERKAAMAVAWIVIILVLAFVLERSGT